MKQLGLLRWGWGLCLLWAGGLAWAQNYPVKPIKVIVGYAAGGAVDIVARTVGQSLSSSMGQAVVVENKPGAGTNIAVKSVIAADPDGYTLMLAANALAANMALYKPAPFDAERDLVPVSLIGRVPVVIATGAQSGIQSLPKLLEMSKGRSVPLSFASPGNGSTPHMAVELFARAAGISLQHVPYRGGTPAITDTIGGQVPLVAVNALEVLPHARSGKLKVLAVLSPNRTANFPDVPTMAESGFPGFEASVWYGLVAPAATPKPIVQKLHAEVQRILALPDIKERLIALGAEPSAMSTTDFAQWFKSEIPAMAKIVKDGKITVE